jgi:hypothetical protein
MRMRSKLRSALFISLTISAALLLIPSPSLASPIVVGNGTYDLTFSVATSVPVTPGQTAFVPAVITNTGTLPIIFQHWDSTLPIGGFGWNFNSPGFAVGFGGYSFLGPGDLVLAEGLVDPVIPRPFSCCNGTPDFSNVSDVTINPGNSLTFVLYSVSLAGSSGQFENYIQLNFGDPVFRGFESTNFTVTIFSSEDGEPGSFIAPQLRNFGFGPNSPSPTTPEPASLLLLGTGLALCVRRLYASREAGPVQREERHNLLGLR